MQVSYFFWAARVGTSYPTTGSNDLECSSAQRLRPVVSYLVGRTHGKPSGQSQERLLLWKFKSPHRNCKHKSPSSTARGVSNPTTEMGPSAYCMYRAWWQSIRKDTEDSKMIWRESFCLDLLMAIVNAGWLRANVLHLVWIRGLVFCVLWPPTAML